MDNIVGLWGFDLKKLIEKKRQLEDVREAYIERMKRTSEGFGVARGRGFL
jgi:hypothetical protein